MDNLFPSLAGQGAIAIDTEANDPDMKKKGPGAFRGAKLAGVSIATEAGFAAYYPVGHEAGNMPKAKVMAWLRRELARPVEKVGANLLYDLSMLHVEGVQVAGPFRDIQVAEPLLDENRLAYGLEALSKDYLGIGKTDEALDAWLIEKFGKKNPKSNIWRAPPEIVAPYAIDDCRLPLKIWAKQKPLLEAQGLWDLFSKIEAPLLPVLLAMKARGVRVDLDLAERIRKDLAKQYEAVLGEIKRITGRVVEPWAAKSIQAVFDELGLEYPLTPKTRVASFTAQFLTQHEHPAAQLIVEARRIDKMIGTFIDGCILESHVDGRVHCQFNQLKSDDGGAVTGRFSSSHPNLQFIPIRTEEGKKIRAMFLPDAGGRWWKKDWSQVEYRLIVHDAAHLGLRGAGEVAEKYRTDPDTDFHEVVAEMTGLSRVSAKTVNFGLAYGEGVDKLCRQLGLSRPEGEALLNEYHRRAPFIRKLSWGFSDQAAKTGQVRTLLNRLRRFDLWVLRNAQGEDVFLHHAVRGARRAGCHKALNARIQGSAADLMKKSMVDIWSSGACDVLGPPQLTVHDELDGTSPGGKKADEALREVAHIMETCVDLLVPLRVDSSTGANWGTCK